MLANPRSFSNWQRRFLPIAAATLFVGSSLSALLGHMTLPGNTVNPNGGLNFSDLPLSFEPNVGQTDPSVRFVSHIGAGTLYFTQSEVVIALAGEGESEKLRPGVVNVADPVSAQVASHEVRMELVGSNKSAVVTGGGLLPGKVNYFVGNDPSRWRTGVPTYSDVVYSGLYEGIDLHYAGTGAHLKGTYLVAPGADPTRIHWRYNGAESVNTDQAGNMEITLAAGGQGSARRLTEQAPVAWQDINGTRTAVDIRYVVGANNEVRFAIGSYNPAYQLVVDPTLTYSTYLGGSQDDRALSIAVDGAGSAYITGFTFSTDFPIENPYQSGSTNPEKAHVFVTKLSASGSAICSSVVQFRFMAVPLRSRGDK